MAHRQEVDAGVRLHEADTDLQQLLMIKKEEDWSPCLDQNPEEPPHIKEEQEEVWNSQEGEELQGLQEADVSRFTVPVPVKGEDDEEKPQSSQLHPADGEDCGGAEPGPGFQPDTDEKTSHSSEAETDDSWDWEDTRERQQNKEPAAGADCDPGKSSVKQFSCSVCGKTYPRKNSLKDHMRLHSEGKRFSCSVCKKTFQWRAGVVRHMRIHTGEKPFSCYFCDLSFAQNSSLVSHVRVHTGEKPFKCSICKARFRVSCHLSKHMRLHSGDKPFGCSECGKRFAQQGGLRRHSAVHTGEKPFSCSVCGKRFARHENVKRHLTVHTAEKPVNAAR